MSDVNDRAANEGPDALTAHEALLRMNRALLVFLLLVVATAALAVVVFLHPLLLARVIAGIGVIGCALFGAYWWWWFRFYRRLSRKR